MQTSDLNRIMKEINLPNKYIKKGRLAYYLIKHNSDASILVGLYLDNTSDKDTFFLQYFVQCLFIPSQTLIFSLGDRIGNHWTKQDLLDINNIIKNFNQFDRLNSFVEFIEYLRKSPYYGHLVGKNQCFAYTYFILKSYKESLHYLNEIIALKNHSNAEWFENDIKNAECIKDCIIKEDYNKGIDFIIKWQKETMLAIKLCQ
ncbi:hypothetical protein FACS189429_1750 [Bacteroidia bacterium]|nr:hypothetical protein FACS189429_1750 [Bacteroidia bacterium]GHV45187.1 hypothetical protein FACS1894180_7450 [Bacteroidia bacterium]